MTLYELINRLYLIKIIFFVLSLSIVNGSVPFRWLRQADRAIIFPCIQQAIMPSFGAANAIAQRLFTNRTGFHKKLYYKNYHICSK